MTKEEIWDWQCQMFVYSCYLYEMEGTAILSDEHFDQHCVMLRKSYDQLPTWFTARVPKGQLDAGTGLGLEFTAEDREGARLWWERVRGTNPPQ